MSPEKQREIASKGGRAAHMKGTAHEWTSAEARAAGQKGGRASRGGRGRLPEGGRCRVGTTAPVVQGNPGASARTPLFLRPTLFPDRNARRHRGARDGTSSRAQPAGGLSSRGRSREHRPTPRRRQGPPGEQRLKVRNFDIQGVSGLDVGQLTGVLATRESGGLIPFFGKDRYFSARQLQADLYRIIAFMSDHGWPGPVSPPWMSSRTRPPRRSI